MSSSLVTSPWFRFTFPLMLLAAIWYGMNNVIVLTRANAGLAGGLPYALFLSSIAIAFIFKQSRMAMVACTMLISYWVIQYRLQSPLYTGSTLLELSILSFVLPVACLLSYAFKNGDLLSRAFFVYLILLACFGLWAYVTVDYYVSGGYGSLKDTFLFSVPEISKLPFILVLYLLAMVGITGIFVLTKNRIMDVFIYTAILMSSTTFIFFQLQFVSSTMFSLSGALMMLYLISASHEMAFNDQLTQLPGRHALEIDLRSPGRKFAIAMVDIDHFKSFNDSYGHDTGDDVLKLVASRIRLVKGKAKIYRYGGEEFTILFKGKTAEQAKEYLEQIRQDIEQYDLVIRDSDSRPKDDKYGATKRSDNRSQSVNITISVGVCDSSLEKRAKEAIKRADEALYQAKKAGRNRIKIASYS